MSKYFNNCFCCGYYLVPRYKRLVNNIFSQDPQHGPDRDNLARLYFYSVRKPEKLDRSFRYMSQKIARYLRQGNIPYVKLGIEAMNATMTSCYEQLNTFVEFYLETLQLVLEERNSLELTEYAIASFESFCKIREEAPNYQRNYEFFVERFTQLCHYNVEMNRRQFRRLGLRGHRALIHKTANDELQNDIWKYMNYIIASIMLNLEIHGQDQSQQLPTTIVSPENVQITSETIDENDPSILAVNMLRDLFRRAHCNNISACVQLILTHLDHHAQWVPADFPKYVFSEIINSMKYYNISIIIGLLLNHLKVHFDRKETTIIKPSIIYVIHDCLVFATENTETRSIMFDGILSLISFLENSFQIQNKRIRISSNNENEQQVQYAIITEIGYFAEKLSSIQMMIIMQRIIISLSILNQSYEEEPQSSRDMDLKLQLFLLKTIQKIATNYQLEHNHEITSSQTTFPHQLFDPLLKMMTTNKVEIRLIVLKILQLLIDKRHYADKFRKIKILNDVFQLDLPTETKRSRLVDITFMEKFGRQFLSRLYECILMNNNTKDIYYAIYCLMNLVTLEAAGQDVLVDIVHFCFEIQSTIIKMMNEDQKQLSTINFYSIHALIAAYFNLMSKLYRITSFSNHVDEIIHSRELYASYLLPPNAFHSISKENLPKNIPKECLFIEEIVTNALNAFHYDTSRFNRIIHLKSG